MHISTKWRVSATILSTTLILAACSDNNSATVNVPDVIQPVAVNYTVTVTNLTASQPLSPVAVVLHDVDHLWQVGSPASAELEQLAESGANSDFLQTATILGNANGNQIIPPGDSQTIDLTINDRTDTKLSTATMLVNTNDAFAGIDGYDLSGLMVGDSISMRLPALDAGTEDNAESSGTIPGPADGGEGFNAVREARNTVAYHAGVVSSDDGLSSSVLSAEHRFDNAVLSITVTRTQ